MTVDVELGQAINESFRAILALTGSPEAAERAVTNAIGDLGLDGSRSTFLAQSVRWAFFHTRGLSRLCLNLPCELQVLSFLEPIPRYCFVLRLLLGLDAQSCAQILKLSLLEVDEALYRAFLNMPRGFESAQGSCADPNTD